MPIRVTCTACANTLSAPDSLAGKVGKCKCGQKLSIPHPDDDAPTLESVPPPGGTALHQQPQGNRHTETPTQEPGEIHCLKCRSGDIVRVSVLFSGQTWSENSKSAGNTVAVGAFGGRALGVLGSQTTTNTNSQGSSNLAFMLKPRAKPQWSDDRNTGVIILFVAGIALLVAISPKAGELQGGASLVAVVGALVGVKIISDNSGKNRDRKLAAFAERQAAWSREMTVWDRSFHCSRCGFLSDLVSGHCADSSNLPKFLADAQAAESPRAKPPPPQPALKDVEGKKRDEATDWSKF